MSLFFFLFLKFAFCDFEYFGQNLEIDCREAYNGC